MDSFGLPAMGGPDWSRLVQPDCNPEALGRPTLTTVSVVGIVSYRLGGADGVSIEAEKWAWALGELGWTVRRIAGSGPSGVECIAGLDLDADEAVDETSLRGALHGCDLVIVENLCSLPLNPAAGAAVARVLRGRPAILRHHDLAWQRPDTAGLGPPPDDPAWRHVTINELNRRELAEHGIEAACLHNRFEMNPPAGDRHATRDAMGVSSGERVLLQPTRAIARKNVPGGLALAEALGATYWLTAAAEDGFGPVLDAILQGATVRVLRGQGPGSIDDAYAACDAVVLPSTREGFGNPAIEAVTHRKPLALGRYPVAAELLATGLVAFDLDDASALGMWLDHPDPALLDRNLDVARAHFDLADLPAEILGILRTLSLPSPWGSTLLSDGETGRPIA